MNAKSKKALPTKRLAGGSQDPNEALWAAVVDGSDDVGALMAAIAEGASAMALDAKGRTPLMIAVVHGNERCVKALSSAAHARGLWAQDSKGRMALHFAALSGHVEILDAVASAMASVALESPERAGWVDAPGAEGRTALTEACRAPKMACARLLLSMGADPRSASDQGMQALDFAAEAGDLGLVKLLADKCDPDHQDKGGMTALMRAVYVGEFECAIFLSKYPGVDLADEEGRTALMMAARSDWEECVDELVGAGADPWRRDLRGSTALFHAINDDCEGACVPKLLDLMAARASLVEVLAQAAEGLGLARALERAGPKALEALERATRVSMEKLEVALAAGAAPEGRRASLSL